MESLNFYEDINVGEPMYVRIKTGGEYFGTFMDVDTIERTITIEASNTIFEAPICINADEIIARGVISKQVYQDWVTMRAFERGAIHTRADRIERGLPPDPQPALQTGGARVIGLPKRKQ